MTTTIKNNETVINPYGKTEEEQTNMFNFICILRTYIEDVYLNNLSAFEKDYFENVIMARVPSRHNDQEISFLKEIKERYHIDMRVATNYFVSM